MHSILKTVSTPVKWVSKFLLNHTLLRFPGGDAKTPLTCTYCPEMCRFACPTAIASGNDAVTPCNKMSLLYKEAHWKGSVSSRGELWPIFDCTGCGRCTEYCVYGVPVAATLFEARRGFKWKRAKEVARELSDADDPVGDLADELGEEKLAERRAQQFLKKWVADARVMVDEPRVLFFIQDKSKKASLSWEAVFKAESDQTRVEKETFQAMVSQLRGRPWLIHESVWLSRRLKRATCVKQFLERLQLEGVDCVLPFANGLDAIDCGGEGIYARLFPDSATRMALDFWERDQARANGILCFSERCEAHYKNILKTPVPVWSIPSLWRTAWKHKKR